MVPTRRIAGRRATDAMCGLSPAIAAHKFLDEAACKPIRIIMLLPPA